MISKRVRMPGASCSSVPGERGTVRTRRECQTRRERVAALVLARCEGWLDRGALVAGPRGPCGRLAAFVEEDVQTGHAGRACGLGSARTAGDGVRGACGSTTGSRALCRLCRPLVVRTAGHEPPTQRRAELGPGDPVRGDGRADRRRQRRSLSESDGAARVDRGSRPDGCGTRAPGFHRRVPGQAGACRLHGRSRARHPRRSALVTARDPVRLGQLLPARPQRAHQPRQRLGLDGRSRPRLARADPRLAGRRPAPAGRAHRGRCRGHRRPSLRSRRPRGG